MFTSMLYTISWGGIILGTLFAIYHMIICLQLAFHYFVTRQIRAGLEAIGRSLIGPILSALIIILAVNVL
jgi:hypothetical protein